jgi:hypothetical protein
MRSIVLGCLSSPFDLASVFDIAKGTLNVVFSTIGLNYGAAGRAFKHGDNLSIL